MGEAERAAPPGLLKISRRQHIESFIERGDLYMRTLREFAAEEDPERGDPFEGTTRLFPADAELQVEVDGAFKTIPGVRSLRHSSGLHLGTNVYCMYGIWALDRPVEFSGRNAAFGDYFAFVSRVEEFLGRAMRALPPGTRASPVEYVDDDYAGEMGPFRKRRRFEHQSEFRIAVTPGAGKPLTFPIGSLSDLVVSGPVSHLAGKRIRAVAS